MRTIEDDEGSPRDILSLVWYPLIDFVSRSSLKVCNSNQERKVEMLKRLWLFEAHTVCSCYAWATNEGIYRVNSLLLCCLQKLMVRSGLICEDPKGLPGTTEAYTD